MSLRIGTVTPIAREGGFRRHPATIRASLDVSQPSAGGASGLQDLLADLSARFAAIPAEALDDAIVAGLHEIAELLHADRAMVWRKDRTGAGEAVHSWIRSPHRFLGDPAQIPSIPFVAAKLKAGQAAWFSRPDDVADPVDRVAFLRQGLRSAVVVPMVLTRETSESLAALAFASTVEHEWTAGLVDELRLAAAVLGQALMRQSSLDALRHAHDQIRHLRERMTEEAAHGHPNVHPLQPAVVRDQLKAENLYLRHEVEERNGSDVIIGRSAAIQRVLEQAQQVAATDSTVLLLGETGTGKELVAAHIHGLSARRSRLMVRVNCSAIPGTLMESELFGREKGAYTGALAKQVGRFELADRSTIFLDEIGDLPPDIQVKLLRVLEVRQIERLGSPKPIHVDVRIIAATHRDLEQRIIQETFREDLFYRLNVFPIQVPPLRDRVEDIPLLVWRFVDEFSRTLGRRIDAIHRDDMAALQEYRWPGNVRELRNVVERAMILATGPRLKIAPPRAPSVGPRSLKLADVEREHVRGVLESAGWRIRGAGGAAERLGLKPTTLETRMSRLGIARPRT